MSMTLSGLALALLLAQATPPGKAPPPPAPRAAGPADEVHLKNNTVLTGEAVEYDDKVLVLLADGTEKEVPRTSVSRISYSRDFIRFPVFEGYAHRLLDQHGTDIRTSAGRIIMSMGKRDVPVVVVDPTGKNPPAEFLLPDRVGAPIIDGVWLYLLELKATFDDKQKVKIGAFEEPKKIHALTLHAINLRDMKEAYSHTFDNNDKKPLLWEFVEGVFPVVVRKDDLVLLAPKKGYPIDAKRVVDQSKLQTTSTLHFIPKDPAKGKPVLIDVPELFNTGITETNDTIVWQEATQARRIFLYDIKRKKVKGEISVANGEGLAGAMGRLVYTVTPDALNAFDIAGTVAAPAKGGGFPIPMKDGRIERLEPRWLVIRRGAEKGRPALEFYDPANGKQKFAVPYGVNNGLQWMGTHGKYLIFTDSRPALMAVNASTGEPFWLQDKFPPSPGLSVARTGNTLYATHADRIHALDLHTGSFYWSAKTVGLQGVLPAGRNPVGYSFSSLAIVREVSLPAGSKVLDPDGIPPVVRFEVPWLAPPQSDGDLLRTVDAFGALRTVDTKTMAWDPPLPMCKDPMNVPVLGLGPLSVCVSATGVVIFDRDQKKALVTYPVGSESLNQPIPRWGDLLVLRLPDNMLAYDLKARQELWKIPFGGPRTYPVIAGEKLYGITSAELLVMSAAKGKEEQRFKFASQSQYESVHVDAEGRVVLRKRGEAFFRRNQSLERDLWSYEAKGFTPQTSAGFPGWILFAKDRYLFSNAGGSVVALEPGEGKELWKTETPKLTSTMLMHQEAVYFADYAGSLRALKIADGKDVFAPLPVAEPLKYTPMLWNGKVWFWSTDGLLLPTP